MLSTTTVAPTLWLDDAPPPLVLDIEEALTGFTSVAATLTDPAGEIRTGVTASIEDDTVEVTWPTPSVFDMRGIFTLQLALSGPGVSESVAPVRFVVQDGRWHTVESAREQWRDAPDDDVVLFELLDAAHTACVEYAPTIDPDLPIPSNYRQAQLLQARAVWTFGKTNSQGTLGPDGFEITSYVYPLDNNIKQLLRPKQGVPVLW